MCAAAPRLVIPAVEAAQKAISIRCSRDFSIQARVGVLINITGGPELGLLSGLPEVNLRVCDPSLQEESDAEANIISAAVIARRCMIRSHHRQSPTGFVASRAKKISALPIPSTTTAETPARGYRGERESLSRDPVREAAPRRAASPSCASALIYDIEARCCAVLGAMRAHRADRI